MPREVKIPQAVGVQTQQQPPGPGPLQAAAAAEPAQLAAEKNRRQMSSPGRFYPHSLASLAVYPRRRVFCCVLAF